MPLNTQPLLNSEHMWTPLEIAVGKLFFRNFQNHPLQLFVIYQHGNSVSEDSPQFSFLNHDQHF